MKLEQCDAIFARALTSTCEAEFCHHIGPLFDVYQILSFGFGRGNNTFWRARLVEGDPWPNLQEMDYPPPGKAKANRLNDKGSPCFYVASREETALLEIHSQKGQLVQLAGFKIAADDHLDLIVVGEYAFVHKTGYIRLTGVDPDGTIKKIINKMPSEDAVATNYIDRFFASILSDPKARDSGYMFSRALGAALHSRVKADGIAFPSVRDPGGFNYAVLPEPSDRAFRNVACALIKIENVWRYNLVEYAAVGCARSLDAEGNFVWDEPYHPNTIAMYHMTKDEYDQFMAAGA